MIVKKKLKMDKMKNFKKNIEIIFSAFDFFLLKKIKYKRYFLLIIILISILFYIKGYRIVKVFSNSDQNGIYLVLPFKQSYNYELNNYVAFCLNTKSSEKWAEKFGLPPSNICKLKGTPLVKHICAIPNDKITLNQNNNFFYKNDKKTSMILMYKNTKLNEYDWNKPLLIESNSYFLCGKNQSSYDSRYYGAIPKSSLLTKVILLIPLPENKFQGNK